MYWHHRNQKLLLLLFIILCYSQARAQIAFHRVYSGTNETVHSFGKIVVCKNEDVLQCALITVESQIYFLILRIDPNGEVIWSRKVQGTEVFYGPGTVAEATNGDVLLFAVTKKFGSTSPNIILTRLDSIGNFLWGRMWDGSDSDLATDVLATGDDGCLLLYRKHSWGDCDIILKKLDAYGNTLWCSKYSGPTCELGWGIIPVASGGYMIFASRTVNPTVTLLMIRLDENGNLIWNRSIGKWDAQFNPDDAIALPDGGFMLCGGYTNYTGTTIYKSFILRTDASGHIVYCKRSPQDQHYNTAIEPFSDDESVFTYAERVSTDTLTLFITIMDTGMNTIHRYQFRDAAMYGGMASNHSDAIYFSAFSTTLKQGLYKLLPNSGTVCRVDTAINPLLPLALVDTIHYEVSVSAYTDDESLIYPGVSDGMITDTIICANPVSGISSVPSSFEQELIINLVNDETSLVFETPPGFNASEIRIFDMNGRSMAPAWITSSGKLTQVSVKNFAAGCYLLLVQRGRAAHLFIKQ